MLRLVRSWMRAANVVKMAALLTVVCGCGAVTAFAQLPMPKLTSLTPPGGKAGSEFELKITGGELENADRLMFSHPGITATAKMEPAGDFSRQPRPVPNTFTAKIAGDVPPGLYEVRAVGYFGMSNPRTFQVGSLEEVAKTAGISSRDKAQPVAVGSVISGQADGDSVDYYKITAAAGQRLLVDCFAQRIDSRMDPALVLYDTAGRELRRVSGSYGSDPVLEINAQAAGDYIVGVHDFTYNGGAERFYRLAVHSGPHIDFVFPPVGQAGASSKFTIYGRNLPGGQPVDKMNVDGSQLQQVAVDIALPGDAAARQKLSPASSLKPFQATVDAFTYQLNSPQGASNPVAIGYATAPLVVEAEPNNDSAQPQMVNVPCEFVGQFYPRGDLDWVQFAAQKGDVFWVEVVSHRLGLPTDPIVVVERVSQNDKGEPVITPIVTNDDMAEGRPRDNQPQMFSIGNRDPRISFEAGESGNYRVGVRDLYGDSRGDPRMVYRLAIRKAQPDFQVLVFSGVTPAENNNQLELTGLTLRRGQASKLTVAVDRRDGFAGEVQIVAEGLPAGVTCTGALVGGKTTDAALVVQAAADAPAAAATFRIVGKAKINDQDVTREARHGALTWGTANQEELPVARMTRDIAISVIDKETAPATATAGAGTPIDTSLGATIKVPIKVARYNGFAAGLKFRAEDVPQNLQAKETDVNGADGEMEIALNRNDIQPGTYTFNLSGQTKIKYTRNPEGLKAAEDRFKELDEILKDFTEKTKQAGDAARVAQEQANQKKDDKALADAAKVADANAKALEEKRKQAENLRRQFEQELNQIRERSKERDLNYWVISSPVTLRIAPTPITVAAQSPGNKKQGEKFQIPVTIERKFGFDDVVEVTLEAPGGVNGISAPQLKIEKGQNQGNLEVTFNENATAGMHAFTLRGRVRYNNVQLDQTLPLALGVDPK